MWCLHNQWKQNYIKSKLCIIPLHKISDESRYTVKHVKFMNGFLLVPYLYIVVKTHLQLATIFKRTDNRKMMYRMP